jgi:hypothetical protein
MQFPPKLSISSGDQNDFFATDKTSVSNTILFSPKKQGSVDTAALLLIVTGDKRQ